MIYGTNWQKSPTMLINQFYFIFEKNNKLHECWKSIMHNDQTDAARGPSSQQIFLRVSVPRTPEWINYVHDFAI